MKSDFSRYVEIIVNQTECSKEEKADMAEEMIVHLEMRKEELISEGMSSGEAERKAMEMFGSGEEIGAALQQSVYPYRKEFMLTLSIVSFIFIFSAYLLALITQGDAYIVWLISAVIINSLLLFTALNQFGKGSRRRWMNGMLIAHILNLLFGFGIISSIDHTFYLPLAAVNWLLIILTLALVYQTTIYETNFQKTNVREAKWLHTINFPAGIVFSAVTLFFIWAGLWLFEGFQLWVVVMVLPLAAWSLLYWGQMKLLGKNKPFSFALAGITVAAAVYILVKISELILLH
ncbi:permease prefix domain 1-containing protein [Evansella clarkii]|uniref:permease prefix domain 1-containing protein n=1 Tax=Evansella clarkii TaxID=79879 RepID=UPI000B42F3FE|nr:permease prefix domain 1-containing protein [Evansella clarkii]